MTAVLAVACALALLAGAEPETQPVIEHFQVDSARSRVDFDITALWILRRRGRFDAIAGELGIDHAQHLARIDIRIPVASVWMKDTDHRELLLSPAFFDATVHPEIRFRSDAFSSQAQGEVRVGGQLSVRGLQRPSVFRVRTEGCVFDERPQDCRVYVSGVLQRSRFGMVEYTRTLADEVRLEIEIVLQAPQSSPEPPADAQNADAAGILHP